MQVSTLVRALAQAERSCGTLTSAEEWTLEQALAGEPTKLPDRHCSDRLLRPVFIRWVLGAGPKALPIPPTGLRVEGALIDGRLDLANARFKVPLHLVACELPGGIDLRGASTGLLNFSRSATTLVRASGLQVRGDLRLRDGFSASQGMLIPNAKISGNLDCRGAQFNPIDTLDFPGTDRHQHAKSEPAIVADQIEVGGNVLFSSFNSYRTLLGARTFEARGGISIMNADIKGMLDLSGTFVSTKGIVAIRADAMQVGSSVLMRDGFAAHGQVRLRYAQVGGRVEMISGKFYGPNPKESFPNRQKCPSRNKAAVLLDGIRITGNLDIGEELGFREKEKEHDFECHSEFRMRSARIQGDVNIDHATFKVPPHFKDGSALSMAERVIDGRVGFYAEAKFEGVVHMPYCRIGGSLIVESQNDTALDSKAARESPHRDNIHAICAYSLTVEGDVRFGAPDSPGSAPSSPTEIRSSINLSHSRVGRSVTFRNGRYSIKLDLETPEDVKSDEAIIMDEADVGRHIEFIQGCYVLGTISIHGIRVGQNLRFTGCRFLDLRGTRLQDKREYLAVDITNGNIAGDLEWRLDPRDQAQFVQNPISFIPPGTVSFARLQVQRLYDQKELWPIDGDPRRPGRHDALQSRLWLDGFTYATIHPDSAGYDRRDWLNAERLLTALRAPVRCAENDRPRGRRPENCHRQAARHHRAVQQ